MATEEERNWSELPEDLIHLIAKKLPDLVDFIRFRAVCETWRSSAPLSDPPHQLPWLLELFKRKLCHRTLRRRQKYYSVSSGQTLTIPFTDGRPLLWSWIDGGAFSHYLAFNDVDYIVSFLNPLTNDRFSLPAMTRPLHYGTPWMVWTGTDPIRDRCVVVVDRDRTLSNEIGGWCFYDPCNNEWVDQKGFFYASCYWKGKFFSTSPNQATEVFDAYSKELLHEIPPPEDEVLTDKTDELAWRLRRSYLVVSSGVILRVSWFCGSKRKAVEKSVFHISRLDFETADGKPCWVRITDIGDQILFLQEMHGFSVTARSSTGFRQICIYFILPKKFTPYMYDILTGTVERVPCPFNRCTWFLPGL
ncbi:F-box family protein [Rhynchospora pubera]|uniref:F-box family protein n=1 Tax=Rhynchospora pubera TaxID=906938 RepID=A0AAV8CCD8_9POAL|nr:F-box family protein [Rhynchospora pubera]